ncbi:MAG: hypothetical protein HQM10_26725 [Candidatus Riflebacteria bacterium]|nr:hypothetical protein [Candidatus Riflebacteria bacterium]
MKRGSIGFEVLDSGNLVNSAENVELLRKLWLDRDLISGELLGPGDPGDFDYGAWHSSCHLVSAGGVAKTIEGKFLWLEISYDSKKDEYYSSVSFQASGMVKNWRLDSADGRKITSNAKILGFVEGNSNGRISARNVIDPPKRFNLSRRQDYDMYESDPREGGKVWEHWCTLRDFRKSSRIGTSVLTAYISLTSVLGDSFPAIVARGRSEYGHPEQLCAMVKAGFVSMDSAIINLYPKAIPEELEKDFCSANVGRIVPELEKMGWDDSSLNYFMFSRKIGCWVSREETEESLEKSKE